MSLNLHEGERLLAEAKQRAGVRVGAWPELVRELCDTLAALLAAAREAEGLRAALSEVHEYNCGCDTPGRLDLCVAQPVVVFAALHQKAER